jgi:hypothetical protein
LITDTYVGGLLGVASVDQERGSGVGYNLQGAHYFFGMFGAGLFIHGGSHTQGLSSFFYGAQALFRPLSILPRLQLGALLARGRFSAGGISGTLNPAYGAKAAYDVALSDHYPITAGLELSVLSTTPNDKTFLIFSPLASLKLWL